MLCNNNVFPALGGDTIRDLCPFPVGAVKSIILAERSSVLPLPDSKTILWSGKRGVKFSKATLFFVLSGISKLIPSILSMLTIIFCMYCLSQVMKSIPVGITYASFAGLCIIATVLVGIIKFNQMPNIYSFVGLILIISGVLIVNLLGKN